jgi:hypothetical protein
MILTHTFILQNVSCVPLSSTELLNLTLALTQKANRHGMNRIVVGDVNGQLKSLSAKLSTLHDKNNFSFAIVAGDLFDEDDDAVADLLDEKISIPLPTYFTVGLKPLPQHVVDRLSKDEEVNFLRPLKIQSSIPPSTIIT